MENNWLDEEVSITYRDLCSLLDKVANESIGEDDVGASTIAFNATMRLYKDKTNKFPY